MTFIQARVFFSSLFLADWWQTRKNVMTNVSYVSGLGLFHRCSLCLSPTTVWRASEASQRRPYAFHGSYLSECHTRGGGVLLLHQQRNGAQRYRRASLPTHPARASRGRASRHTEHCVQNQRVSRLKGSPTNSNPPTPTLQVHYHSRKCDAGFY